MNAAPAPLHAQGHALRTLKIVARRRESSCITSFDLEPADQGGWCSFEPGQFLVLHLPAGTGSEAILRSYSISSSPARQGSYRITVKREAAPGPDVPEGRGSCFLHDRTDVGDLLLVQGPCGEFTLKQDTDRPVVLLSGGVGLTPLVSMLHALAETSRRVFFIHACDNGDVHALRDEVETVAASRAGMTAHFAYRFPTTADTVSRRHHSEGVVTRELLQSILPLDEYDFYLCGPAAFMQAMYGILRGLGVPPPRIAHEFFGPASQLEPSVEKGGMIAIAAPPSPTPRPVSTNIRMVEFRRSAVTVAWTPEAGSLLAFAENQGLAPGFSCRAGICGTCRSQLIAGEVDYFEEPLNEPAPGEVLLCCSTPRSSVILDL